MNNKTATNEVKIYLNSYKNLDGAVLDDYKATHTSYYNVAGRTDWPFEITSDMTWLLLDGYERTGNENI